MFGYTAPKPLTEKQQHEEGGGAVLGSGKEKIEGGLGEWSCGGSRERPAGIKVLLTQGCGDIFSDAWNGGAFFRVCSC